MGISLQHFIMLSPPLISTAQQPVTLDSTMADKGKTFVMNIGDMIRIKLDYGYCWSTISDFNPAILVGAADGYLAFASGPSTLTMTGDPTCHSFTPPCVMPSIMFSITVIVQYSLLLADKMRTPPPRQLLSDKLPVLMVFW